MFKSEGVEESSKYGCLATSVVIHLRSVCFTNGARTMAFIIMVKVAHFVFTTHHTMDHNSKSPYTQENLFWPPKCSWCALFIFSTIKNWKLYNFFWHNLYTRMFQYWTVVQEHLQHTSIARFWDMHKVKKMAAFRAVLPSSKQYWNTR